MNYFPCLRRWGWKICSVQVFPPLINKTDISGRKEEHDIELIEHELFPFIRGWGGKFVQCKCFPTDQQDRYFWSNSSARYTVELIEHELSSLPEGVADFFSKSSNPLTFKCRMICPLLVSVTICLLVSRIELIIPSKVSSENKIQNAPNVLKGNGKN